MESARNIHDLISTSKAFFVRCCSGDGTSHHGGVLNTMSACNGREGPQEFPKAGSTDRGIGDEWLLFAFMDLIPHPGCRKCRKCRNCRKRHNRRHAQGPNTSPQDRKFFSVPARFLFGPCALVSVLAPNIRSHNPFTVAITNSSKRTMLNLYIANITRTIQP